MRSNYKPLSKYIQAVNDRNTDGRTDRLLGIKIDKYFMPSVANVVGTDLSVYKIVKKGQFACNRMHVGRDKRLPVALSKAEDDFIVSPAYDVFEIIDEELLCPEYLMMWFSRKEFDRNAWFYTDADVRGGLSWSAFCNMKLPVPSIEKQREIVEEYNVIVNRIKLNEQLNQKLEETAQAIYKQWFVDFEFPDERGKPYRSSGGEMVFNDELEMEIPKGWESCSFKELSTIEDGDRGKNYPSQDELTTNGHCLFLGAENVSYTGFRFDNDIFVSKEKDDLLRSGKLKRNDIVITTRGSSIGKLGYYSALVPYEHIRVNSGMLIIRANTLKISHFLFTMLKGNSFQSEIKGYLSGSAQPQIPIKDLVKIPIIKPEKYVIDTFFIHIEPIQKWIDNKSKLSSYLKLMINVLLAKMTKAGA